MTLVGSKENLKCGILLTNKFECIQVGSTLKSFKSELLSKSFQLRTWDCIQTYYPTLHSPYL